MFKNFIFYIAFFVVITVGAASAFSLEVCTDSSKQRSDTQKEETIKKAYPDYKRYLSGKTDLGFDPSDEIFMRMQKIISHQCYAKTTSEQLAESMKKELTGLFEAAGRENPLNISALTDPLSIYEAAVNSPSDMPKNLIKYCCICGLFKGTGDPYSAFLTPKEYSSMMESLQAADFGGIGIYLELDKDNNNLLTVIEPIEGTPSWNQGLKAGDVITEVDGVPTAGMDIDMCTSKLRGPRGTHVILTVKRKGFSGVRKYNICREMITVKSLSSEILDDGIGYIKLRSFGRKTGADFKSKLEEFTAQNVKGIIIDLRNNGGGYVNAALDISSLFIESGKVIISVKNRDGKQIPKLSSGKMHSDLPVAILINKYSASASELMAGAFQDHKRGLIIGTKSFGKGSIQQLLPLRDGSAFKVTTAHYCTPNGRDIDKTGLIPDCEIEIKAIDIGTDKDEQINEAKKYILQK